MSRAEQRRKQREQKKADKQMNAVLRQAGFPEFQLPPAPMRTNKLSMQEVANLTGTKVAVLENWRKEATAEIEKACIATAQEKLNDAETFITVSNIIATLSSLQGFHWARSAANWILEHYNEHLEEITEENIRETYEKLHKKWGIEMEFDVPDLNILMGFEGVDWIQEYIKMHIPKSVYDRIWEDSENIQAATMQVATAWELCQDFGFSKHDAKMMERFWKGYKEKYEQIDIAKKNGITDTCKMIKEKYGLEIRLPDYMKNTIERFGL